MPGGVTAQLDLFGERYLPLDQARPAPPASEIAPQLDLFGDRHLQLERARRALAEGRTRDACRELDRLRACYPDDPAIAAELKLARVLQRRLGQIEAAPPAERPRQLLGLLALSRAVSPVLGASLLRRAALELGRRDPTALLDDQPASVLLLQSGDLHAARAAAEAAVGASPRARFLAHLADVEHRLDRRSSARARYRQALALDPHDVDWDGLADEEVRSLPDIAHSELELDPGVAWAAPVGVVLGVLPLGEPPPPAPRAEPAEPQPPSALEQARRFLAALVRASREPARAIDARREMRALAPQLLAAYLARR